MKTPIIVFLTMALTLGLSACSTQNKSFAVSQEKKERQVASEVKPLMPSECIRPISLEDANGMSVDEKIGMYTLFHERCLSFLKNYGNTLDFSQNFELNQVIDAYVVMIDKLKNPESELAKGKAKARGSRTKG